MNDIDVRWMQRFQNYSRAFTLLRSAIEDTEPDVLSDLEKEGVIQRFEYTFELAWKTLKDYLEYTGTDLREATPRKVIKECAAKGIFEQAGIDAHIYLDMMLERNALSHTYDFERFVLALKKIKSLYLKELGSQYEFFAAKRLDAL